MEFLSQKIEVARLTHIHTEKEQQTNKPTSGDQEEK